MDIICSSPFWDANVTWNTDEPDFTDCFKKTVLVWVPFIFLLISIPIQIRSATCSHSRDIPKSTLYKLKALLTFILLLQSIYVFLFTSNSNYLDISVPLIKITSYVTVLVFLETDMRYGVRSSCIMFFYWLLSLLCGISQFYWTLRKKQITDIDYWICTIEYVCIIFMFALSCIVNGKPNLTRITQSSIHIPEEESSFICNFLFMWFDKIAFESYTGKLKPNTYGMGYENLSENISPIFQKELNKKIEESATNDSISTRNYENGKKTFNILPIVMKVFAIDLLKSFLWTISNDLITFVPPFVLRMLIAFTSSNEPTWRGYFYATLLLVSSFLQTCFLVHYGYITSISGMRIRTALFSSVYQKVLKITNVSRNGQTAGKVMNIISTDTYRIYKLPYILTLLFSIPFRLGLVVYFLWTTLGLGSLYSLSSLILIPIMTHIVRTMSRVELEAVEMKDKRLRLLGEILSGIKTVKLEGLEDKFEDIISDVRFKEIKALKKITYLNGLQTLLLQLLPYFVSVTIFSVFIFLDKQELDLKNAFFCVSLVNEIKVPVALIPSFFKILIKFNVSLKRLNGFFNYPEIPKITSCEKYDEKYALMMDDCTFLNSMKDDVILRNINLNIKHGNLVGIIGNVGSGKSSLLLSMMGELCKINGQVNISGRIGYTGQQPWIIQASLRDNVLLGLPVRQAFYDKVIEACDLIDDYNSLSFGDATLVTENATNLTFGQKQRISLARVVCNDADIILFDDPLTGLDVKVSDYVFQKVLSNEGILRNKTRLMVTHDTRYLHLMDYLIVMENGSILQQGKYCDVMKKHIIKNINEIDDNRSNQSKRCESDTCSEESNVENIERMEEGQIKCDVIQYFINCLGFKVIMGAVSITTTTVLLDFFSNYWLSIWSSDKTIVVNGTRNNLKEFDYIAVYSITGVSIATFYTAASVITLIGILNMTLKLHGHLLSGIMKWPLCLFDIIPSGRILNRFSEDIMLLENMLPDYLLTFIQYSIKVVSILIVIIWTVPTFTWLALIMVVLLFVTQRFYASIFRQSLRFYALSKSPVYSSINEVTEGAEYIRALKVENQFQSSFEKVVDYSQTCSYIVNVSKRWADIRLGAIEATMIFGSVIFAVRNRNILSSAVTAVYITYAVKFTGTLRQLIRALTVTEANIIAVERIKEYLELYKNDVVENYVGDWPSRGKVVFENCAFSYQQQRSPFLKNITFSINPGEKIGVIGRTGVGKSSLVSSLLRIIEPTEGRIFIDDIDIRTISRKTLRSRITVIPQESVIFPGSLRFNLDPKNEHSDDRIWKEITDCQLNSLFSTYGLDYEIQGDCNLSTGQRQLICFMRSLLKNNKIVILDETTAHIDEETDQSINEIIKRRLSNNTVLIIAHRISSVIDADRIVILNHGSIERFDTPATLIKEGYLTV